MLKIKVNIKLIIFILLINLDDSSSLKIFNYLQIRGSIPVYWTQHPTLIFKPPCKISENQKEQNSAFELHADYLLKKYNKTAMVNLVDKQGYQKRLGDEFQRVLQASKFKNEIEYTWFDYHAQCKGMKVENCQKLMKNIKNNIDSFGWMEALYKEGIYKYFNIN